MREILKKIDHGLATIELGLIVIILTAMVLMAFLQVLLRNLFSTGILWGDIFLRHLVLWVGFVGASLATRDEKHINIDILTRYFPKSIQPYFHLLTDFVTMGVCLVLTKASYVFLQYEIEAGTTLFEEVPSWSLKLIIPLGFALIAFRYLLKILERILFWGEMKERVILPMDITED
ncbi:MAG: TRAP transporter small permease [Calditrichaeota bacterium]|nr:MAG: TRAP transporter small permease [Calditrichota bacterium]